ncbi:hypothetical protein [Mesorhizobium sp. SP-1A]|uniref:hypothetical protein n=1 Tax=Mesorhizobium sp. SP-1A TaxID=3077840 RepID=UPI0028F6E7A6|nr:hypothetical protein [Mesorhizobium sp. SP-1A]
MKNLFIAAGAALILSGTFAGSALAESYGRGSHYSEPGRHHRPYYKHHRVCRDIYKKRVVWRHGQRQVIRVKVGRRCY